MKLTLLILALTSCAVLAATEEKTNRTFQTAPGGTLVVDVDFGSIAVSTNSTDAIAVQVWRKITRSSAGAEQKFLSENPVEFTQEGNTITIRSRPKTKSKFHWFSSSKNHNEAKYTVQIPAQFNCRLNTSGGDLEASNLTGEVNADTSGGGLRFVMLHGPVTGETSGGDIDVSGCEGPMKIHTSGGNINVSDGVGSLTGDTSGGDVNVRTFKGPVSMHTSGGDLSIENVAGQIKGGTSGGSIHAVLLSPMSGDVNLSTSGGEVKVKVHPEAAFNLEAETSGGEVQCDLPVTMQGKLEKNRIKGAVNGGGPLLKLGTSGGDIFVEKS